jgi:hypothetical protein
LGVSAIVADTGNSQISAIPKIATPTGRAGIVLAAVPTYTYALAFVPYRNSAADRIDDPGDLVPRNARVHDAGPHAFFREDIAMTDATGLYFDAHLPGVR